MYVGGFDRRTSKKAVAVHEAGHLFVNLALAPTPFVDAVWLKRTSRGQWEGCVEYRHRFQWMLADAPINGPPEMVAHFKAMMQESARRELLVSLAGPVAEIRWRLRSRAAAWLSADGNAKVCIELGDTAGSDFGYSKRFIEWLGFPDPHAAFVAAWMEAERLIARHWPSICEVGSLLKDCERIEAEQLYDLPQVAALQG